MANFHVLHIADIIAAGTIITVRKIKDGFVQAACVRFCEITSGFQVPVWWHYAGQYSETV